MLVPFCLNKKTVAVKRITTLLLISSVAFAQPVSYSPLTTNSTLAAKTIDVSLPVGSLAGSAGASGGATYSLPIAVPPGTNGITPSLSVEYSSMSGSGLLGMGWSLSGMSSITRTTRTVYHDGIANPIELSGNDRFSMDGTRLVNTAGIYGADGTTYVTESESFATITSYSNLSVVGTGWFKVVSKDGTIMEYGNTADSRMTDKDQNYTHVWRLNKIQYPDGNYIEFKYYSRRDFRISEINYTGNTAAGLTPYNKIQFDYKEQRIDFKIFHDYGTPSQTGPTIIDDYLLDKITVLAEGQTVKSYQFNYGNDNINSYLNEIIESGSDGSSLNSTLFKYGDKPVDFESATSNVVAGQSVDLFSGDFDSDGYSDILAATYSIVNSVPIHTKFNIYKRSATSSTYTKSLASDENLLSNSTIVGGKNKPNGYNFLARDYSGDGVDDLLTISILPTTPNQTLDKIRLYQFTNGATGTAHADLPFNPTYNKIHPSNHFLNTGDFNGDGVEDVLTMLSTNGSVFVSHLYFGNQSTTFGNVSLTGTTYFSISDWPQANQIHVVDFNGDGKSDLMLIKDNTCEIVTFDDYGARRIYFSTSFPTKDHLIYFGDFNGDHKTDILTRASQTNNAAAWSKALSTGKSFISSPFSFSHTPQITGIPSDDPVTIADFNGDGKTDVFHGWNYFVGGTASTSRLDVYHSQGEGFYYQQNTFSSLLGFGPQIVFDLNGDGRSDLVNLTNYQNPFDIFYFRKEGKENLLEKAANGVNHVTEWSYKKLTDAGSFYTRSGITPAPVNTVQLSLFAVSEFKGQNGSGGISTIQYNYADAKLHRSGKGFLGFGSVTENNLTTGYTTISTNEFSPIFFSSAPKQTSTYLGGTLLSQTTLTNEWVDLSQGTGNRRNWYRVNATSTNNAFEGRTASTTNTYDNYGNITQSTANNNGVETATTDTQYGIFATPIPAKPTTSTTTKTRTGQPAYSITTTYGYNTTFGQLISKTDFSGLSQSVVTAYGYNSLGNQITSSVTPAGMPARTTSATYDAKGRFALTSTNVLGQSSSATYDVRWGKPLTSTGIDGLTTSYQYDAWGRTTQTNLPEGYAITQSWIWDQTVSQAVYYNLVQHPGKPDVKSWMDVLGREVQKQTEGFGGQWITQMRTYDPRGNVATDTQPYLPGESVLTTSTSYDAHNRVMSVSNPFVETSSVSYVYAAGNLTVSTTNPANQTSSKVTDASGQTISATDVGGTLTYSYNSQGNLLSVAQGANTPAVNEYDDYGRQTKLIDQNAGTTIYVYNAAGELTSQTNANGQTHTLVYDVMGRMTSRTGPEGTTTTEYYPAGTPAVNQIKKITGFAGNITDYTYDGYGRLTASTETIDGTAYTTGYSYNTYGDVISKTFPSTFATSHAYDANGYTTTISSGATTLFTANSQNGLGQPLTYTLGNGKTSTNTYTYGLPTHYQTPGVQDLTLTWDYPSGNLQQRADAIRNKQENFYYDNLNRLTDSEVVGQQGQYIAYSPNGNITDKNDAGTYSYLASKPNAVSAVTNPTMVIPGQEQFISYTPFLQPHVLTENNYELTYTYGADYERIKGVLKQNNALLRTRYYTGAGYEKDISTSSTKELHYIDSPAGLIAIVVRENGSDTYHYVYTDHLGSILTTTTSAGAVETATEQNFDAWGRRRNPSTWAYTGVTSPPDWLYRGYTGHEHLDPFVLINMNGRIYDPVVGRVLSPDNFVQDPFSTQGFNRYAYGFNNPLKYTDPDGQFIHIIVGGIIGGLINGIIHIDRPGGFWKGFAIGAVAGGLVAATGGAAAVAASTGSFAGAFSAAAVSSATSGAIGGAIAAAAGTVVGSPVLGLGNKAVFGDPYSLKQYGKDVLFAGLTGGVASGIGSALGGKNFWTGKATPGTSTFAMPDKALFRWRDSRVGKVTAEDLTGTFEDFIDDKGNLIPKHGFTQSVNSSATNAETSVFGKEISQIIPRVGRNGNAAEIHFKDGSQIDINSARVKEWVPNLHPNAPVGTLQKVRFEDFIEGSKGYKRLPTQNELNYLHKIFK